MLRMKEEEPHVKNKKRMRDFAAAVFYLFCWWQSINPSLVFPIRKRLHAAVYFNQTPTYPAGIVKRTTVLIKSSAQLIPEFFVFYCKWSCRSYWSIAAVIQPQMLHTSKVDLPPAGCQEKNHELIAPYLWSRLYKGAPRWCTMWSCQSKFTDNMNYHIL